MCPKSGKTTSCKDGKQNCDEAAMELIWQMQFLVKDPSSQLNKNFYRVMLYSGVDGAGRDFFGHPPCNLYRNQTELENLTKTVARLQKFNIWVDAIVERKGNYFVIRETNLKP